MMFLDRVHCDCCGDEIVQILGGVPTASGVLVDQKNAPHFAICPNCFGDGCEFLGLPDSDFAA